MAARKKKKKAVRKKKPIIRKKAVRIKRKATVLNLNSAPSLAKLINDRNQNKNLRDTNIAFIKHVLEKAGIKYEESPTGREIIFGTKKIKVNHNGQKHWTIRVPCGAKDGIRLQLGTDVVVQNDLFVIGDTIAIKYND